MSGAKSFMSTIIAEEYHIPVEENSKRDTSETALFLHDGFPYAASKSTLFFQIFDLIFSFYQQCQKVTCNH